MAKINIKKISKIKFKVALIVVLVFVLFQLFSMRFGTITEYIYELDIVFVPTSAAERFRYSVFSGDVFEYWIFELNDLEEKLVLKDIENGNWDKLRPNHIEKLDSFNQYRKILGNKYKNRNCYICIYDCKNNEIITNSKNMVYEDTSKWLIFLYDIEYNRYFCIHQTL